MIFPPTAADVEDMLMRLLCIGRLRIVTKLNTAEEEAELDRDRFEYWRDAQRRSRLKKKGEA